MTASDRSLVVLLSRPCFSKSACKASTRCLGVWVGTKVTYVSDGPGADKSTIRPMKCAWWRWKVVRGQTTRNFPVFIESWGILYTLAHPCVPSGTRNLSTSIAHVVFRPLSTCLGDKTNSGAVHTSETVYVCLCVRAHACRTPVVTYTGNQARESRRSRV